MAEAPAAKDEDVYLVVRTRSILACVIHWVLFLSVVTLTITGLYIAWPVYYLGRGEAFNSFAMAEMRLYHFLAATALIVCLLARFYLSFTESCNRDIKQFIPTPRNIINAVRLGWFFLTLRGKSAHYRFVNPLGGIGIFLMAVFMFVLAATGFLLFVPGASPQTWGWAQGSALESLLGGQQNIRLIHHLTMYLLIFVVLIHVYMQIWKNSVFTESDISSIIAGYKIFPISQIGHFADYYGLHRDDAPPTAEEMERESKVMIEARE